MAYNYEYPYTDPNRYNADWLLNTVKKLEANLSKKSGLPNRILYIGDSYMVGIGGAGNDIPNTIAKYYNNEWFNFAVGGTGFIRTGADNMPFIRQLTTAAESNTFENNTITHIIVAGGYNDMGLVNTQSWNEQAFYDAINDIAVFCKNTFKNAQLTIIPFPWINIEYNNHIRILHSWLVNACLRVGANYAPHAVDWLMYKDASYQSGDNVHPSKSGYQLIAACILSTVLGTNVDLYKSDVINSIWGNTINVTMINRFVYVSGIIVPTSSDSGQFATLPDWCPPLTNKYGLLYKYGTLDTQPYYIFDRNLETHADRLTQGDSYIIEGFFYP